MISERAKTVLVVEDNADDTFLLRDAAERVPGAVAFYFVAEGHQALQYLKGEGRFADRQAFPMPELVLLDLWLPDMDGLEILSWIRSRPELKQLKVFVWTDSSAEQELTRATKAGADRFIPKSVAFVRGGLRNLIGSLAQAIPG